MRGGGRRERDSSSRAEGEMIRRMGGLLLQVSCKSPTCFNILISSNFRVIVLLLFKYFKHRWISVMSAE